MHWLNEPAFWRADADTLTVTSGARTDFWRKTHYGFIRDNGNFYYQPVTGNFMVDVKIAAPYSVLYDQAGLMLRQDETTWLKCGIEYFNDMQHASAVVTRDFSDWSIIPLPSSPDSIWLRVRREGGTVEVFFSLDGEGYTMYRTAHLSTADTLWVGPMVATPERDQPGLTVTFEGFKITPEAV